MSFSTTDYKIYQRKDGGIGISPYGEEVTLLNKGEMVYAQRKNVTFDGTSKQKCSLIVSPDLAQDIRNLEEDLHAQYENQFQDSTTQWHSNLRDFAGKTWLSFKISKDVQVFEKSKGKLKLSTLAAWPEESMIFPTFKISAWLFPINAVQKVGITLEVVQVFFEKASPLSNNSTPMSLAEFL